MNGNNNPSSSLLRNPSLVANDVKYYQEKFGANVFSFGNETLTRNYLFALSHAFQERGIHATFDGYSRTDQFVQYGKVDEELIEAIAPYFRFLQFGIESSDSITLRSMRKARKADTDSALMRALFSHDIYPHVFFIVGYPPDKKTAEVWTDIECKEYYVRSALVTLSWFQKNKHVIGTYKATRFRVPRDDHKLVEFDGTSFTFSERYNQEIILEHSDDLEFNLSYEKRYGSTKLDAALLRLFEIISTPYKEYTHGTIYHQRLFNWEEGVRWSQKKENRALRDFWNVLVDSSYRAAQVELRKKGGVSQEKRDSLLSLISKTQQENVFATHFPEGIPSLDDLLCFFEDDFQQKL